MEMRKCLNGHYYDASIHVTCPYCTSARDMEKTVAMGFQGGGVPMADDVKTIPLWNNSGNFIQEQDSGKTVALMPQKLGIKVDPVVGWLVCVDGADRGKDYRIHSENNYLGRDASMDICITGDEAISRQNQAIITYDTQQKKFYLSSATGRSMIRLNGNALFQTTELHTLDHIIIGATELLFVALCGEDFQWEEN